MICCGIICYQDFKERAVYAFLFPVLGMVLCLLHYLQIEQSFFFYSIGVNSALISLVLLVLYGYTRFLTKGKFYNHSLGLGDMLFFFVLGFGFPTLTFIVLFANAIFFSLITYLILKKKLRSKTVPLAGLMSAFLTMVLLYDLFFDSPSLYMI